MRVSRLPPEQRVQSIRVFVRVAVKRNETCKRRLVTDIKVHAHILSTQDTALTLPVHLSRCIFILIT